MCDIGAHDSVSMKRLDFLNRHFFAFKNPSVKKVHKTTSVGGLAPFAADAPTPSGPVVEAVPPPGPPASLLGVVAEFVDMRSSS